MAYIGAEPIISRPWQDIFKDIWEMWIFSRLCDLRVSQAATNLLRCNAALEIITRGGSGSCPQRLPRNPAHTQVSHKESSILASCPCWAPDADDHTPLEFSWYYFWIIRVQRLETSDIWVQRFRGYYIMVKFLAVSRSILKSDFTLTSFVISGNSLTYVNFLTYWELFKEIN